jgi:predicted HicB family RNase H-like nuclease
MKKEKIQNVVVKIEKELHKKLKIRAINEEKTLEQLVDEILRNER